MLRQLLFETRIGDLALALLERLTGLAVVSVREVRDERARTIAARGRIWRIIG